MHDEKATAVPFLDTKTALVEFVSACPRRVPCCVDTEADSLFSYREKLCLVQFAVADRLALIDPLTIDDLSPLLDYLDESSAVWIHGSDYDLSILNRTYGRIPRVVYDTQIAARLLGWRTFGLAHLIESLFDVALSKQSQKKNWGERPLPERMLEYAANDVRYILSMAERFSRELKALGRWEWFEQSCQAARDMVLTRPEKDRDELWRIPGWGKLEGRAMAYLRELWAWRDEIACRRDKPPFKIISNQELLHFSERLARGETVKLHPRFRSSQRRAFEEAVAAAAAVPKEELPVKQRGKRLSRAEDWESVFNQLRSRREAAAKRLDIEAAVIASKASLERYAFVEPVERTPSLKAELFIPWQETLLFPGTS